MAWAIRMKSSKHVYSIKILHFDFYCFYILVSQTKKCSQYLQSVLEMHNTSYV